MKKIKKIITLSFISLLAIIGIQSCDLEEYNPSGSTADVVFSTPEGIEYLINRMYYNFRWKYFGREDPVLYLEGGTDLWYNAGREAYGAGMTQYTDKMSPTLGQLANVWNRVYDDINMCNSVINRIGNIVYQNREEKDYREGEARWLRSYCYWWLCEFFGDIELRLEETSTPSFIAYRTPAETIYDEVIIPDAKKACEQLQAEPIDGMAGRYTRKAAYGLLARVALARASYCTEGSDEQKSFLQMAKEAADYVIDHKSELGIKLYGTYNEVWKACNNKNNTEFLAVVTHSSISTNNPQSKNPNRLYLYFAPKLLNCMGCKSSWEYPKEGARMMPTRYLLQLFKEGDGRYDVIFQEAFLGTEEFTWTESSGDLAKFNKSYDKIRTRRIVAGDTCLYYTRRAVSQQQKDTARYVVVDVNTLYNADGTIKAVGEDGTTSQITYSFPRFQKYRIYDPDSDTKLLAAVNGTVGYADVPLMRYAEMPLIAAECAIRMGNAAQAVSYITDLRSRIVRPGYESQMAVNASDMTIDFILDERARELCGEWLRWMDLKRTGKLVEYIKAHNPDVAPNIKEYHSLRPIPSTFLDKLENAGEFGQNPGY